MVGNSNIHRKRIPFRRYLSILILGTTGIIFSILLFFTVHNWEKIDQHREFEFLANAYANNVEHTLGEYIGALRFLGDFFNHSPQEVSRKQFTDVVDAIMSRYDGIRAFGWNPLVKDEERALYESNAKKEGYSDYEFMERNNENKLVKAKQRKEYVVVYYIHPVENNREAFGYDIASNPVRYDAIKKSFETGKLNATERLTLVQEKESQYGVLILLPIFHGLDSPNSLEDRLRKRKGFVVEVLSIGTAIDMSLGDYSDGAVNMAIYDITAAPPNQLLYIRQPQVNTAQKKDYISPGKITNTDTWSRIIDFAGRRWKILIWPSKVYLQSRNLWQSWAILLGSLTLTIVLGLYMFRKITYTIDVEQRIEIQSQTNHQLKNEIQEHKKTGESLEFQNNLMTTLLDNIQIGVFMVEAPKGEPLLVNKKAIELLGRGIMPQANRKNLAQAYQAYKIDTGELYPEDELPIVMALNGKQHSIDDMIVINPNGEKINLEVYGSPVMNQSGEITAGLISFTDITNRKKMEAQLLQSQKMESIGNLAGGIAHEFNNILSIIIGNNELVMAELPEWSIARESTEEIRIAGMRARDVVKQLLTFSRQDSAAKKVIELRSVVQESIKLIRSSTPANIKIQLALSDDVCHVLGNETQINQMLINLCNNAIDALPQAEAVLTVELSKKEVDKKQSAIDFELKPGKYVMLKVTDNGTGMSKETLGRIFEPYFTTKEIGKGSGIGLAVVHGIAKRHGGNIIVNSKLGMGSTFTIFFPAYEGPVNRRKDEEDPLPKGDECILFIDDEPSIAKLGKRHLETLGYAVESTTDPIKALKMIKSEINKFDLVISDMAMPNMTGDQLISEILKIRPGLPTIICTGYSANVSEKEAKRLGISAFVMKPLDKAGLAKKIRQVLDGESRSE